MLQWISHNNPSYKFKILDYTYTSEPSINSALPLKASTFKFVLYIIGIIMTFGFLWLLVKWSSKRKAIILYNVCSLQQATHFLIQQEEIIGGSTIVQHQTKFDIRNRTNCISFSYHQRQYLFYEEKEAFLPIRYEQLGIHLDQLKRNVFEPYSRNLRPELSQYYGYNIINLPIQNRFSIFISQMLTPYEVFQTYAIILWIFEQYYIFSFILLSYALYTYWQTSSQVIKNQAKLSKQSYFQIQCKIIINQNDNVGAINLNDQAQIQKINQSMRQKMGIVTQRQSHDKKQLNQQIDEEPQVQLVTRIVKKQSIMGEIDTSRRKSLLDRIKVKSIQINSKELLPGDVLVLHQGDTVPCDCIILKGQILVDQSYITGQKYLTRKFQLQNFTYKKESQNNFTLHLGTKIAKIKVAKQQESAKFISNSLEESIARNQLSMPNEIVCLVINTNYNTLRGKYLRAIRHQKKQQQSFTLQTIYFIYILIALVTIIYLSMMGIFKQGLNSFQMFITYLDLIFTCIPPTLPTLMSVGINFAQHRLKHYNISCVLPSNILTCGKVDTIVLEGHHALGKEYQVQSMMIGTKSMSGNNNSFGETYSTVQKFYSYHQQSLLETSSSSLEQTNKRKQQRNIQYQFGQLFINAVSVCHGLEYFQSKIQGKPIEKKIFEFSQAKVNEQNENQYQTKNYKLVLDKKIYFKQNQKKMAVVTSRERIQQNQKPESQSFVKNDMEHFSLLDQGDQGLGSEGNRGLTENIPVSKSQELVNNAPKKIMFVKGDAQKVLAHCNPSTYPKNSFQYIVDMAQKGFNIICYAYLQVPSTVRSTSYYMRHLSETNTNLTFLGFLILKQIRYQDNIQAIKSFKKASIKLLLVSQQRQLQTSSIAILNQICDKKELLLCSLTRQKNKIYCKGHTEWQSTYPDPIPQFVQQFQQDFGKNSYLSLMSTLYEQLFMRRDSQSHNTIFEKSIIFNRMEYRHQRNLYSQLDKRENVSFAVGGGGIVSECANLSMELQRDKSSLLSSFYTKSKSLMTIFHCLRICRAGLATNFHVFSMMILFSLIQFTTVILLYINYQALTDTQMLYQDLFVTFPIFIALNLTKPSSRLSKQRPLTSFFDSKAVMSMLGQIVLQFLAQMSFILYLLSYKQFQQQKQAAHVDYISSGDTSTRTIMSTSSFILSNYLYLGIVLSTSVSKPFRKPFYTNPFYTLILIALWIYNTLIVVIPQYITTQEMRATNISNTEEEIVVLALIFGNLMMVLMYLYQNMLTWIWTKCKNRRERLLRNPGLERTTQTVEMKEVMA